MIPKRANMSSAYKSQSPLAKLRAVKRRLNFEETVKNVPSGIVLTDNTQTDGLIRFVNEAFTTITGYASEEAVGRNCRFLQGAGTDAHSVARIHEAVAAGRRIKLELLNYRKNGEEFWNELIVGPEKNARGDIIGFVGVISDVTARRTLEARNRDAEARLESVLEKMPGYVFQRRLSADGKVDLTHVSQSFSKIVGIPATREPASIDLWRHVHPDDRLAVRASIERSGVAMRDSTIEFRLKTTSGVERWIRAHSTPRRLETGDVVWDGVAIDITAERVAEDRLSYLAYHDPLTGMPNRLLFDASLQRALGASAAGGPRIAAFLIDIDGFQEVNEAVGTQAADAVLRGAAKRVADFVEQREGYCARTGGDEFAAFFAVSSSDDDLRGDAGALCGALMLPLLVDDREFAIEACVGVATFPFASAVDNAARTTAGSELLKRANIALRAAKQAGRGVHRLYSAAADDRHRNHAVVRQSLRKAIDEGQFRLHYHPVVDLGSGAIIGAEALIRWSHPTLGLQRPDIFIPLAEKTGLIVPLGAWVTREAIRQSQEWARMGLNPPKISINVSGVQLQDPGFIDDVGDALARTGVSASQFEIELTESFMIEASPAMLNVLGALKDFGFSLAIDDFGTGHSTFRYLRDFPFDKVKIDQTFVRQMVVDSSDASIIRAIIALAKSLRIGVIAEGIETVAQRNFLRDEGCRVGQGYLFSLPLNPEDFGDLLNRGVTLPMALAS
jgi:diguanylate cyclase (GGDEF)-like protein/PAS domain S-box-containing protein